MRLKLFIAIIFTISMTGEIAFSQDAASTILSIDELEIPLHDYHLFVSQNDPEGSKTLKENSRAFVDYQLRLYEAKQLGCDSSRTHQSELMQFRSFLARDYIDFARIDENDLENYHSRMLKEVEVSHIQVDIKGDLYKDTLSAYSRIDSIRRRILNGESFKALAYRFSEASTYKDSGYIGFFTGMESPFPLEEGAFNTEVGEVSQIFRTSNAYHLVTVRTQKETKGAIRVERIFKKGGSAYPDSHNRKVLMELDSIRERLKGGADFQELARAYSDIRENEEMEMERPWIRSGGHSRIFVDAAFDLKTDGEISPIIRTPEGFYLIKRMEFRPIPTRSEAREELVQYYRNDPSRQNYLRDRFVRGVMNFYGFSFNQAEYDRFVQYGKYAFHEGEWIEPPDLDKEGVIFSIGERDYLFSDFSEYLEGQQYAYSFINYPPVIKQQFQKFFIEEVLAYEDAHLESRHPDFRAKIESYASALLINCVGNEIWQSASTDSAGLKKLYKKNQDRYKVTGFNGLIIRFNDIKSRQKLEFEINNSKLELENLDNDLQKRYGNNLTVEKITVKKGANPVIDHFIWKQSRFESGYTLIMVKGEIIKLPSENLNEVISDVVIDYSKLAEEKWIRQLRKKHKIKLNKKVLKTALFNYQTASSNFQIRFPSNSESFRSNLKGFQLL